MSLGSQPEPRGGNGLAADESTDRAAPTHPSLCKLFCREDAGEAARRRQPRRLLKPHRPSKYPSTTRSGSPAPPQAVHIRVEHRSSQMLHRRDTGRFGSTGGAGHDHVWTDARVSNAAAIDGQAPVIDIPSCHTEVTSRGYSCGSAAVKGEQQGLPMACSSMISARVPSRSRRLSCHLASRPIFGVLLCPVSRSPFHSRV